MNLIYAPRKTRGKSLIGLDEQRPAHAPSRYGESIAGARNPNGWKLSLDGQSLQGIVGFNCNFIQSNLNGQRDKSSLNDLNSGFRSV